MGMLEDLLSALIPSPLRAIGTAGAGLIGSVAGGFMGDRGKPTPIDQKKKELLDQLMDSFQGNGPFSNLYNVDEQTFQKSFVDPMKQKFQSQIAPQIQQSYVASGQERGTGMEDALTRAGVDMDQLLNQFYAQMQEGAMNRQSTSMQNILGMESGPKEELTGMQAATQGLGGFLTSPDFSKGIGSILDSFSNRRKGFENSKTRTADSKTSTAGG